MPKKPLKTFQVGLSFDGRAWTDLARAERGAPVGDPGDAMEEDDIDDDDQPRVVYADAEREGRMARYAAGVGEGADVSASRGSHGANEGAFAARGPAPGAAPWASDDDVDGAPPPKLLEEEDERTRSPERGDGRASAAGAPSVTREMGREF